MVYKRVVSLCLDGLDPVLLTRWMDAGLLPNFDHLRRNGTFSVMNTTNPPETACAWAAFATGQNPGKTGVFDFVIRDPRTYSPMPGLITMAPRRGNEPPRPKNARHGDPLWKIAGDHGLRATVLNLPVTWPPDPFAGRLLSGMGAPDVAGTMGIATHYSTAHPASVLNPRSRDERIVARDGRVETVMYGPNQITIPLQFRLPPNSDRVQVSWPDGAVELTLGQLSDWYEVRFPLAPAGEVLGLTRFCLLERAPHLRVYVAPPMNHPRQPSAPITWPPDFAGELYSRLGAYRTLGREVDIFALLANMLDLDILLADTFASLAEREQITRALLDSREDDLLISWFGQVDTTQHGYWTFTDPQHPLYTEQGARKYGDVIQRVYQWLDGMVCRLLPALGTDTLLVINSDHGCTDWRRSVHFNTWLWREGYLTLKDATVEGAADQVNVFGETAVPLTRVNWSRTRAYSFGCGKVYINQEGREGQGIVTAGPASEALEEEISARFLAWRDPKTGGSVVSAVYRSRDVQWGPQMFRAPELIVGLRDGYRVSWTSLGQISLGEPVEDNLSALGGDHISVDYELVPGSLFSNARLDLSGDRPHILDIAPTILTALGLPIPAEMDGRNRLVG